ncbi:hypothetical protein DV704_06800 [Meiothermus sp. QL-1]|uniref:hypothetical protein n=1 Tax=Meiothermus sp. QL-1 TaxID=2058095 RepID=UPI000E0A9AF4|nr:hypothetical protein [Meiothermus sp. QL-1]RDI95581.1 hypothetical protein DV704_06800 [Meiothermus sp. QL-1]
MLELRVGRPAEPAFLRRLQQGRVPRRVFLRWLGQKRHLLEADLALGGRLLLLGPQPHRLVWVNLLAFMVEELDWLAGLELPREPLFPSLRRHLSLQEDAYASGVVALWARKQVFFQPWNSLVPEGMPDWAFEAYLRWTGPEVKALLHDLGGLVLELLPELPSGALEAALEQALALEEGLGAAASKKA